jgi:hypothetical protein
MNSPYYYYLKSLRKGFGSEKVTIDRADTTPAVGTLNKVASSGCTIAQNAGSDLHPEASRFVFVAYEDIRGVSHVAWDHEKIGK